MFSNKGADSLKSLNLFPLILFFLITFVLEAQVSYSGVLGNNPITLVSYHYSDEYSMGYYVYNKFDTPISLEGVRNENSLELYERDETGRIVATLRFDAFHPGTDKLQGKWIAADSAITHEISLSKDFDLRSGSEEDLLHNTYELLQQASTENHYFKTIVTREKGDMYARVYGVKIFEKRTDRLIQTISVDCRFPEGDSVSTGDYNFDGIEDFSVFEEDLIGSNTSSIYFLKNPDDDKYTDSGFSGTSLEFDEKEKLVYEHFIANAGQRFMKAVHKIVNNKMVMTEHQWFEYNEEKDEFVPVDAYE